MRTPGQTTPTNTGGLIDRWKINRYRKYRATYTRNGEIISEAQFTAKSISEARGYAQLHKRHTPEICKYGFKEVHTEIKATK